MTFIHSLKSIHYFNRYFSSSNYVPYCRRCWEYNGEANEQVQPHGVHTAVMQWGLTSHSAVIAEEYVNEAIRKSILTKFVKFL